MTRWFVLFASVLALALTTPMGLEAAAAKRGKSCAVTAMDGKQSKWRCKASEKCCFNWFANKGTCQPASAVCM